MRVKLDDSILPWAVLALALLAGAPLYLNAQIKLNCALSEGTLPPGYRMEQEWLDQLCCIVG